MTPKALQSQIALGEDSKRQFKVDVRNAESLAAEMAAFANSEGGQMFLGVANDGSTPGLASADVSRINQLISNAASQLVRSPLTVQTENHLFIFDNRIEIISPGHLPNNLTVEKIRNGNSNIRNPILVSYVAKGLLPYHGLGSGIKRALEQWPQIEFADDHDGCLFRVTVTRKPMEELDLVETDAPKNEPENEPKNDLESRILEFIGSNPLVTYDELAQLTGKGRSSIMRIITGLKAAGRLERIGSKKGGHWKIIECEKP